MEALYGEISYVYSCIKSCNACLLKQFLPLNLVDVRSKCLGRGVLCDMLCVE